MTGLRNRKPLSIVALRTHKALFYLLCILASILFVTYLFLMNYLSMEGYILSRVTEEGLELSQELEILDSNIARIQSREFVAKSSGNSQLVSQGPWRTYVVIPRTFTAQK